ncbi:MAG: RNA methyltransferase [Marinilabiliaceae bacterium]|nr:RNA methyltransferase [Marinilabiliaceae bacterium]
MECTEQVLTNKELIERLRPFVTEERYKLLEKKLSLRTRYMTMVLDNIHHSHNASAVVRTCECMGVQDLHVIENSNRFTISNDIVHGSSKWIDLHLYRNATDNGPVCISALRQEGYRIVATTPHGEGVTTLPDFDVTRGKFAIIMGSERKGVSKSVLDNADECLTIPMTGYTESLNISVSAAIIMYTLRERIDQLNMPGEIPEELHDDIMVRWLIGSIRSGEEVIKRIMEEAE